MVEFTNINVYGLEYSIKRSQYPTLTGKPKNLNKDLSLPDIKRSKNLSKVKVGSGHDNFLKGIIAQFDIKYSHYFTPQLQRYSFIGIISSQSKMYTLVKLKLDSTNTNMYVDRDIINIVNKYIDEYNNNKTYENFMFVLSNVPLGFEMWMGITTNYLQLKTIYNQRHNHKLKEDWGNFSNMIEGLPSSYLITGAMNGKR